jgi:hypothetical protein
MAFGTVLLTRRVRAAYALAVPRPLVIAGLVVMALLLVTLLPALGVAAGPVLVPLLAVALVAICAWIVASVWKGLNRR